MKNIEVTYDALICENGTYEQGEAAFILPMTDELAAEYLAGRATDRGAVNLVETALEAVEVKSGPQQSQRKCDPVLQRNDRFRRQVGHAELQHGGIRDGGTPPR